jgi:2-polyprenyl-6-methoxyphenol hydroxylase-like FAD-dependent oxidoreductase
MTLSYSRSIDVVARPDVLVCGAGCAGIGAAVAAARSGARTMVVDRMGFAGGFFTAIVGSAFDGFTDQVTGLPAVGGVVFEMLERMDVLKGRDPRVTSFTVNGEVLEIADRPDWLVPRCDPERFKKAADEILRDSGVTSLFHTQVSDVVTRDGRIAAVVVSNKSGLVAIEPKQVVDCTGDGDVAAWAGAPFELREDLQPMSLHFRVINVVPTPALRAKCTQALAAAHRAGRVGTYGGPSLHSFAPNEIYFNTVRVRGNGTVPEDWTRVEQQGRQDAWTIFQIFKEELPEFKDAYFFQSGPVAGARETRRILGEYVLTEDDVRQGRTEPDVIVLGAGRLDRHPVFPPGQHVRHVVAPYDISYRTLLPLGVENLLVAGRCHSATSEALASSRLTATAMGMGQAAGVAAAMATARGSTPRDVPIAQLQATLRAQGAILERPPVPASVPRASHVAQLA